MHSKSKHGIEIREMTRMLYKMKSSLSKFFFIAQTALMHRIILRTYDVQSVNNYIKMVQLKTSPPHLARMVFETKSELINFEVIGDIDCTKKLSRSRVESYVSYLAILNKVKIVGSSSLIYGKFGFVINDTLADPDFGQFVSLENETYVATRHHKTVVAFPPRARRKVDKAFHLSGLFAGHFGHWYAEFLPRLRHFEKLEGFESVPILVNKSMPSSHFELLKYFCDNELIYVEDGECFKIKELLVAPTITFFPSKYVPDHPVPFERQSSWSAGAMRYMRTKILAHFPLEAQQTRAIYLSRKNSSWGVVSNEAEVEDCLRELGFEIVQPERHSFAEQVAILRSSHTIVAATGSALNSLMLANKDTNMLLLGQAENHNWGGWSGPMRDVGFDPKFLLMQSGSRTEKHLPVEVDINRLRSVLVRMLENENRHEP